MRQSSLRDKSKIDMMKGKDMKVPQDIGFTNLSKPNGFLSMNSSLNREKSMSWNSSRPESNTDTLERTISIYKNDLNAKSGLLTGLPVTKPQKLPLILKKEKSLTEMSIGKAFESLYQERINDSKSTMGKRRINEMTMNPDRENDPKTMKRSMTIPSTSRHNDWNLSSIGECVRNDIYSSVHNQDQSIKQEIHAHSLVESVSSHRTVNPSYNQDKRTSNDTTKARFHYKLDDETINQVNDSYAVYIWGEYDKPYNMAYRYAIQSCKQLLKNGRTDNLQYFQEIILLACQVMWNQQYM